MKKNKQGNNFPSSTCHARGNQPTTIPQDGSVYHVDNPKSKFAFMICKGDYHLIHFHSIPKKN